MYQIKRSNNGYSFITENNVEYEIYFTLLSNELFPFSNSSDISNFYYFGIERLSDKVGVTDMFIRRTVVFAIVSFFVDNQGCVLVFNYSNADKRLNARRRLFLNWFREFSEHTVYQFYQHDFSDYDTVCALYRRVGGSNFEIVKNSIQESIINLKTTTKN